eukprot:COSAG06_NODE_148_length_22056_cov_75.881239_14_plen_37_part_00
MRPSALRPAAKRAGRLLLVDLHGRARALPIIALLQG